MRFFKIMCLSGLATCLSTAAVNGKVKESFGQSWEKSSFKEWVRKDNALLTPESLNLAAQYCLRNTQEQLDSNAYDKVAVPLVKALRKAYQNPKDRVGTGLLNLSQILEKIETLNTVKEFARPDVYEKDCKTLVDKELEQRATNLFVLFEGRMDPKPSANLPQELKEKLELLKSRGVKVAPLTKEALVSQVCQLEGYYSTSYNPKLWKLFSMTRLMANVLPSEQNESAFVKSLAMHPNITTLVGQLDRYSAVAGRSNGLSVGMTTREKELASKLNPVRLTGSALGSSSTALMSFFTTAWREQLQELVLQPDYPSKPFELISAKQVLDATKFTAVELEQQIGQRQFSQTEQGMNVVWQSLQLTREYEEVTQDYLQTANLAWLALNAETNIRQNEKIAGVTATAVPEKEPVTQLIFASAVRYDRIQRELDAALNNYLVVGQLPKDNCAVELRELAVTAHKESQGKEGVIKLSQKATEFFGQAKNSEAFKFSPVIAEIGSEVLGDDPGIDGQTDFRLHLATGGWREVPTEIQGKTYLLGTPSAFVLHEDKTIATREWQEKLVMSYDGE